MIRYDILIAGIGGQGAITLGTILKLAALEAGLEVVGSERRGGAQREGPVTSFVRYYEQKNDDANEERNMISSVIPQGGADLLIALEPLEAVRYAAYLNSASVALVNSFPLLPVAVRLGEAVYPPLDDLERRLRSLAPRTYFVDLDALAKEHFQDPRQAGVICLGLAAGLADLPVNKETLFKVIRREISVAEPKLLQRVFDLGLQQAQEEKRNRE